MVKDPGSFRDPSGFIFHFHDILFRQVNKSYKKHFDFFLSSGLYRELREQKYIIPHEEVPTTSDDPLAFTTLKPERIPFISYPYEWCFEQLKDAALLVLSIQSSALNRGMILKDASAYNVQFHNGKPIWIDTLSFEIYQEGDIWQAYKQFCQHFFCPLCLMALSDVRNALLLHSFVDGIPIDLASKILSWTTYFKFPILSHIHVHSFGIERYSGRLVKTNQTSVKKKSLIALIENLRGAIQDLSIKNETSGWSDYYNATNYTSPGLTHKNLLVKEFVGIVRPKMIWDFGANDGLLDLEFSKAGIFTVSFDKDHHSVQKNYRRCKKEQNEFQLPLVADLMNPSPGIGWNNKERKTVEDRGHPELILSLALIHHLAISGNIPFDSIAEFFHGMCQWLIIEFVPPDDSNFISISTHCSNEVLRSYTLKNFEASFSNFFEKIKMERIFESSRSIYLYRSKK